MIQLIGKVKKDDVFALSSQLAYYLMLSFFPFMLFLMTLIGFRVSSNEILEGLSVILPRSILELVNWLEMYLIINIGIVGGYLYY